MPADPESLRRDPALEREKAAVRERISNRRIANLEAALEASEARVGELAIALRRVVDAEDNWTPTNPTAEVEFDRAIEHARALSSPSGGWGGRVGVRLFCLFIGHDWRTYWGHKVRANWYAGSPLTCERCGRRKG